ncbi:MAG: hypothetical protein ACK4WM_05980 [Thermoflexales bacterium]
MKQKTSPPRAQPFLVPTLRQEREKRLRQLVIAGAIVVFALTALLVLAAALQLLVFEPQRVVASADGQVITVRQLQKRIRYNFSQQLLNYNQISNQVAELRASGNSSSQFLIQLYEQQLQQIVTNLDADQIGRTTLDDLLEAILIRSEANRRAIQISPEELQESLEQSFGFYRKTLTPFPTYTPLPTPTSALTATEALTQTEPPPTEAPPLQPTSITEQEFRDSFQRALQNYGAIGWSEADLRELVLESLYRQRLRETFDKEVPTTTLHFQFDYIRFNALSDAEAAQARLRAGELDFRALISQTNAITQPAPIGNGTTQEDWMSRSRAASLFGPEVAEALEKGPLNTPSPVITSSNSGFYLVVPLAREVRPLEQYELRDEQRRYFEQWLTKARQDTSRVQEFMDPAKLVPSEVRAQATTLQRRLAR